MADNPEVVTFGEAMMAFFSPADAPVAVGNPMSCAFVGAESNVSIGLARLGHRVRWLSSLGDDVFGREIQKRLRGEGVDVSGVELSSTANTGVLFQSRRVWAEPEVLYYRKDSAFASLTRDAVGRDRLDGARLVLLGGIAPALGRGPRAITDQLFEWARAAGIPLWFDVNYRSKLWDAASARPWLKQYVSLCDTVVAGVDEAQLVLETGEADPQVLAAGLRELGPARAVIKCGTQGSLWSDASGTYQGHSVPLNRVVSPIGAGDAFVAGLISATLDCLPPESSLERAHALAAMACLSSGDWDNLPTRRELADFVAGKLESR